MAPKGKKPEPAPAKKLSRGDVDELIDDGTALVEERDWAPALAKLEAAAEGLEGFEEHMVMSRLCSKIGQCQLELRDVNGALRTFEKQLSSAVLKSTSVSGAPDNSSRSHFSAMTWPRWLRRAVGNRHRHAIEQASRRWRGGRKILLSARLRTAAPPSLSGGAQATSTLSPPTISSSASVGADGTRSSARAAANNTSSPRRGCIFWCLLFGYVSFAFWAL